jgi:transcription initiation factor IIE alpha subunit
MARKYYYNPETSQPAHDQDLAFDAAKYREYVDTHPYMQAMLKKCAKEGGVRVPSLKATLYAIGACSKGFCTFASQKTLARKAAVSVRTLQKCIYALREKKLVSTKHRYTKGQDKKRTTSKTTLSAFVKFMAWLAHQAIRAKNFTLTRKQDIDGFLSRAKTHAMPVRDRFLMPTPGQAGPLLCQN